jgi:hypothetical protein
LEYIEKLVEVLPKVKQWINEDLESGNFDRWDSLVINRRKPHTYRVFTMDGENRICLHRFEPCEESDAFKHPHPWPAAFIVMAGSYRHWLGRSKDLESQPDEVMDSVMRPGSIYEITENQTWHGVIPLETAYTIMLNGPIWEVQHKETRTTKGKDLEKMEREALRVHLVNFQSFLNFMRLP